MRVQYIQFAKNEGKYILQQATRRKEVKYEIDREVLVSALFYQDFINQYRETQDKRIQIIELMNTIIKIVPDTKISQTIKDP